MAGTKKYMREKNINEITPNFLASLSNNERLAYTKNANWSFKKAQRLIIDTRLAIEDAEESNRLSFDSRYSTGYIYALLADYADCLAWIMLRQDISRVRAQYFEQKKHSPLKHQNWESIEKSLKHFNRDPYQFALATDLTSFMHIGDVYCVNSKNGTRHAIEVKTGKLNEKILNALHSEDETVIDELMNITTDLANPKKTAKQVLRVLNQYDRANTALKITETSRTDIKTHEKITIQTDERTEESWAKDLNNLLADMGKNKQSVGSAWRDHGLFFMYGKRPPTNVDISFFRYRVNEHFHLGVSAEHQDTIPFFIVSGALGQGLLVPRSLVFLQNLGEERQQNLLSGDEFLFVFIYPPAIQYLLKENGYDFTLKNTGAMDQKYASKLMADLFGRNKIPIIDYKDGEQSYSWTVLPGVWQRIIFDFMAPIELVNYTASAINKH